MIYRFSKFHKNPLITYALSCPDIDETDKQTGKQSQNSTSPKLAEVITCGILYTIRHKLDIAGANALINEITARLIYHVSWATTVTSV